MKSSKDILLLLVVLIGAAAAGMWVLQMDAQVTPAHEDIASESTAKEQDALIQYSPNREGIDTQSANNMQIKKQFEAVVNGFLQDLSTRMNEYRKKRMTVRNIIKPESMRVYEYVKENNNIARNIMAELEAEQDVIVDKFEETDKKMKALLQRMNSDDADTLLREWEVTRKKQLGEYKRFFEEERRLHDLYRIILEVFAESGGAYTVNFDYDLNKGSVNFKDKQLQSTYDSAIRSAENILSNRGMLK